MRKLKKKGMIIILLTIMMLSSCRISVEDFLVAPSLEKDQTSIKEAIEGLSAERTVLKYPGAGDWRSPIHFIDLDCDGVDEAIVFYRVSAEGINTRIAVLERDDFGEWSINSEIEGAGSDIGNITTIEMKSIDEVYLLVEWSSVNMEEQRLAVYRYYDGILSAGLEEGCLDYIVGDLDGDSVIEFCYITGMVPGEPFKLRYLDDSDDGFVVAGEFELYIVREAANV